MIKNKINDTRVNSKTQRKKNLKDLRISPSEGEGVSHKRFHEISLRSS